jgi:hypothetical protein
MQAVEIYATITVQVLAELGLIGAIVCAVALIPAFLLRRDDPVFTEAEASDEPLRQVE